METINPLKQQLKTGPIHSDENNSTENSTYISNLVKLTTLKTRPIHSDKNNTENSTYTSILVKLTTLKTRPIHSSENNNDKNPTRPLW